MRCAKIYQITRIMSFLVLLHVCQAMCADDRKEPQEVDDDTIKAWRAVGAESRRMHFDEFGHWHPVAYPRSDRQPVPAFRFDQFFRASDLKDLPAPTVAFGLHVSMPIRKDQNSLEELGRFKTLTTLRLHLAQDNSLRGLAVR